jgi:hypothetical protein
MTAAPQDTLSSLLEAVSYAEYELTIHFKSRGADHGPCKACQDHEQAIVSAERALRAFQASAEAAA